MARRFPHQEGAPEISLSNVPFSLPEATKRHRIPELQTPQRRPLFGRSGDLPLIWSNPENRGKSLLCADKSSTCICYRMTPVTLRCFLPIFLLFAVACLPAAADIEDRFDTVRTRWQLRQQDCQARVVVQRVDFNRGHGAPGSELVRIVAGRGTQAHLAYAVDRVPVIDELNPTLWIRSDRFDLQLMARIVLPRAHDPRTGAPIETLVRGDFYRQAGSWQQLRIQQMHRLLKAQAPSLSAEHGIAIDTRQAFVSELVLNIYGGPGTTTVWIDDLEMTTPLVRTPEKNLAIARPSGGGNEVRSASWERGRNADIQFQGSVLLSGGQPLMARIIEYNGEPMAWLQQIGFNTLAMKSYPPLAVRLEARKLGLWLITPPPGEGELSSDPEVAERVLAWDLGQGLDGTHLQQVARIAQRIRRIPAAARPLVCAPTDSFSAYQRHVDLVRLDWQPCFSSLSITDAVLQLQAAISQLRRGAPYWVTISVQPGEALERQWQALVPGMAMPKAISLSQLRIAMHRALASGSRGIYFRSSRRLDGPTLSQQQECRQLEQLNLELRLLEPWIAGADPPSTVTTDDPAIAAVSMRTARAQLVWIFRPGSDDQCVVAGVASQSVLLDLPGMPITYRPYLVDLSGTRQLPSTRGRPRVPVVTRDPVTLVVLTDDPLAVDYLKRTEYDVQHRWAMLNKMHAHSLFEQTRAVMDLLPLDQHQRSLWHQIRNESAQRLTKMEQLDDQDDHPAVAGMALEACRGLQQARWRTWKSTSDLFSSVTSSPLCISFETLPEHWKLVQILQRRNWGENLLVAGNCEDLDAMRQSGWRHFRGDQQDVESLVELSPEDPHGGQLCVKMKAWPVGANSPNVPLTAAAWIQTAPVDVHPGDQVRIHGWVKTTSELHDIGDGLLIYDSAGGTPLALRIHQADRWQPFVIYRGIDQSQGLTVTCALAGYGEIQLDDLSVKVIPGTEVSGVSTGGMPR
jgi:uncharacterized protein YqcC (DUF446 family)